MVQVVMMMNWQVWNRQSVKNSYQGLVDEMTLGVYSGDWCMVHIKMSSL